MSKKKKITEAKEHFARRSHEVKDEESQDFFWGMALFASVLEEIEKDDLKANEQEDRELNRNTDPSRDGNTDEVP